ncbi:MAG: DivIVA domain-containing protein, partial [Bacteroidota bacterium]
MKVRQLFASEQQSSVNEQRKHDLPTQEEAMKLTPLDIRKQEFKKVMRGYDPIEVETFMEMM